MSAANIPSSMPLPLQSEPPNRERYVLGQGFQFSRQHWLQRLPDRRWWPVILDDCPQDRGWPVVDRRTVFTLAEQVTSPDQAISLFVAACVWGVGLKARNVARRVRVVADNPQPGQRLAAAVETIRTQEPVAAYSAFAKGGCRLRYLGPSFFTKFLYFAGWGQAPGGRQLLILDQYVSLALNNLVGLDWSRRWGWTPDQYDRYLDYAHAWAARWNGGVEPDVVERTLFTYGRSLAR